MRLDLDMHGVHVRIHTKCRSLFDSLRRDLRYFESPRSDAPQVKLTFVEGPPPWKDVPLGAFPLFRTTNNTVYRVGRRRYVDHRTRALTAYDFGRDEGTCYAEHARNLYEVAYLLILSRVGEHLDRAGLHRLHALAISIQGQSALFLAESGCGKTTLGLGLMTHPAVQWMSDEIPLFDRRRRRLLAFPLPARLARGVSIPWPPPPVELVDVPRTKRPPKMTFDVAHLLERVADESEPVAVIQCRRRGRSTPRIRRLGWFRAWIGLHGNAIVGRDFPRTKAYDLTLTPRSLVGRARRILGRIGGMLRLTAMTRAYRFEMCDDPERNLAAVTEFLASELNLDAGTAPRPSPAQTPTRVKEPVA